MNVTNIGLNVGTGGNGEKVVMSIASAAMAQPLGAGNFIIVVDALCFVRRGAAPVAVVDVDQVLTPNILHRCSGALATDRLAFIMATGTGNAWVSRSESP